MNIKYKVVRNGDLGLDLIYLLWEVEIPKEIQILNVPKTYISSALLAHGLKLIGETAMEIPGRCNSYQNKMTLHKKPNKKEIEEFMRDYQNYIEKYWEKYLSLFPDIKIEGSLNMSNDFKKSIAPIVMKRRIEKC